MGDFFFYIYIYDLDAYFRKLFSKSSGTKAMFDQIRALLKFVSEVIKVVRMLQLKRLWAEFDRFQLGFNVVKAGVKLKN